MDRARPRSDPATVMDDPAVRELIRYRERQTKGGLARLHNQRALERWAGASGLGRLTLPLGPGQARSSSTSCDGARQPLERPTDARSRRPAPAARRPSPAAGLRAGPAVGTTYSLDLLALLTAPVAFAMFDREASGRDAAADPIAALQALRRSRGRITLFCQAGDRSPSRAIYRALVVYLEHGRLPGGAAEARTRSSTPRSGTSATGDRETDDVQPTGCCASAGT